MYHRAAPAAVGWLEVDLGGMLHTAIILNVDAANPVEIVFEHVSSLEGQQIGPGDVIIVEKEDTSLTSHGKFHTNRLWLRSPNGVAVRVDITYTTKPSAP